MPNKDKSGQAHTLLAREVDLKQRLPVIENHGALPAAQHGLSRGRTMLASICFVWLIEEFQFVLSRSTAPASKRLAEFYVGRAMAQELGPH